MRFFVRFNLDLGDIPLSFDTDFYGDLLTKPGNSLIFDQHRGFGSKKIVHYLENILKHEFKVFSDEYFVTNISNPMNFSPTSAYVNIRPENKSKCTIQEYDNDTVDITFKKDVVFNIVDGQHRLIGMRDMMDWTLDPDIEILLTMTHGLTKNDEIEQFITMNKLQELVVLTKP